MEFLPKVYARDHNRTNWYRRIKPFHQLLVMKEGLAVAGRALLATLWINE